MKWANPEQVQLLERCLARGRVVCTVLRAGFTAVLLAAVALPCAGVEAAGKKEGLGVKRAAPALRVPAKKTPPKPTSLPAKSEPVAPGHEPRLIRRGNSLLLVFERPVKGVWVGTSPAARKPIGGGSAIDVTEQAREAYRSRGRLVFSYRDARGKLHRTEAYNLASHAQLLRAPVASVAKPGRRAIGARPGLSRQGSLIGTLPEPADDAPAPYPTTAPIRLDFEARREAPPQTEPRAPYPTTAPVRVDFEARREAPPQTEPPPPYPTTTPVRVDFEARRAIDAE